MRTKLVSLALAFAALVTTSACSGGGGGGSSDNGPLKDLDAVYSSAITVDLEWTNEADAPTGVLVQRSTDNGGPFEDLETLAGTATEYRDDNSLELETRYYYKVVAVGGADDGKGSKVASPGAPPPIPEEPVAADSITATAISPTEIDVTWVHSGENVIGFRLERIMNFVGFSWIQIAELPADARSYSDSCLSPEAPYKYRVTAYNEAGATAVLETLPNTFTPLATEGPGSAPTNLQAIPMNSDSYRIQWEYGCTQAQGLQVDVNPNGTGFVNVLGAGNYFAPDARHFFYIDLPQGSSYAFKISAFNDISGVSNSSELAVLGPVAPEPPTGGWVAIHADYDNWRVYGDLLPTANATAHPTGNLVAGCFWSYNTFLGMQNFNCYSSAVHFPMSGTSTGGAPFDLAGKTIDEAVLVLSVSSVALDPTNLNVTAIATPWSTNTLNGSMSLNLYSQGGSVVGSPAFYGTYGVDVTAMVQNWASGAASNNGILIEDAEYVFPYNSYIRTTFFWSTDNFNGSADNKPTLWVDYH